MGLDAIDVVGTLVNPVAYWTLRSRIRGGARGITRAEDPRVNTTVDNASIGMVVGPIFGTPRVDLPAVSRGRIEATNADFASGAWKIHQLGLLIGQGPITTVHAVWIGFGSGAVAEVDTAKMAAAGMTVQAGNLDGNAGLTPIPPPLGQVWDPPESAPLARYPGMALLRADPLDLKALLGTVIHNGSYIGAAFSPVTYPSNISTSPKFSAKVSGLLATSGPDGIDAEPVDVIAKILGTDYWALGISDSIVSGDAGADGTANSSARRYHRTAGFVLAGQPTDQRPASAYLDEILDSCDSFCVWSPAGKLKILPYGDVPWTNNGATYTPNTTPVYDLGASPLVAGSVSDFVAEKGDDPITAEPISDALVANIVSVEYRNRNDPGTPYRVSLETAQDEADVELNGKRSSSPLALHWITSPTHARFIAQLRLVRSLKIRTAFSFTLGWRFALLEPGDLVTLTDPKLGLDHFPVRIVRTGKTEDGDINVTAVEWPIGQVGTTLYDTQNTDAGATQRQPPGDAEPPVVVPVPALLAGEQPAIWIGATGLSDAYGGCDVYLSADNSAFSFVGTINGRTKMGPLTSDLATGSALDTTHTLAVDLTDSRGILSSTSDQGRDDLENLCVVVNEV